MKSKRVDVKTGFMCNNNCMFCVQAHKKSLGNKTTEEILEHSQDKTITFIPLTTRCNNNCISCSAPIKKTRIDPSFEKIKKRIESILSYSTFISFNGGEPTLRKDLLKILQYAENKNAKDIKLLTNSKMFSYEKYARKFKKIKGLKIITTLYGHNPTLHDSITRTPESFTYQIKGIKNLIKYKIPVELRILLHKMNYKSFKDIVNFIEENFKSEDLEKIVILNAKLTETAKDNHQIVAEKLTEITRLLEEPILKLIKRDYKIELYCFPYCILPKSLWKYTKKKVIHKTEEGTINVCKKCIKMDDCSKAWKSYLDIFGQDEFKPIIHDLDTFIDFKKIHAAYIHVSNVCNFQCNTCDLPKKKKKSFDSLNSIEQKIKKANSLGLNNIIFTGQEVILHPEIDKIIELSFKKENANYVTFNTNGLGFNNKNVWKNLTSINKDYLNRTYIAISVNFFDAKTFSEWSGHKKEVFLNWCNGFKRAIDTFPKILIDVIIKKDSNIIKILDCLSNISNKKSEKIKLRILNLMPYSSSHNKKYSKLKYSLIEINGKINEIVSKHKGQVEFEDFPACIFNQKDLKDKKYNIYNFHMIFEKDMPLQYEIGVFNTYFDGPTENWKIDKKKLIMAQKKMFCYLDECENCYYKKKGSCYGIQRAYLESNGKENTNHEIHILKKINWIK